MVSSGITAAVALSALLLGKVPTAPAQEKPAAGDLSWVEKRVEEWQPRPPERKFDQIGWAADIRAGLALAKKHNRPLYLFTHDGRMERNRCGAGGYGLRVSTLSSDAVISLLNSNFVPVYVSNEDYSGSKNSAAPADEQQVMGRIYTTAANKGLNVGSVRVYLCTPEGDPIEIGGACEPKKDIEQLEGLVKKLRTSKGTPVVAPRPQNPVPKVEPGTLVLHLTARGLPVGSGAFWSALPAEDWVLYTPEEWAKFLPPAGKTAWDVDQGVATKLLSRFYEAEDECLAYEYGKVRKVEYENASMKATLVSKGRVRLDVSLRMKECFANNRFGFQVEATAVGVVDIDPAKKTIKRFLLATEKAKSGAGPIGVAVRSAVTP